MSFRNGRAAEEWAKRHALRFAKIGLDLENQVASLLESMKNEKVITSFEKHPHHSTEDQDGKDFTVTREIEGKIVTRHFGVTISVRSWGMSKTRHPHTQQFCFPIGTKTETMRKHILKLFETEQ